MARLTDLLGSADKVIGAHLLLVEQVNKSLLEGMRVTAREHERSRRELINSIRSQRSEWKKTLASLEKTRKARDAAIKAAEEARLAFERANGDLNVTKAFVEKMREDYATKARKTLVYKEEYIQAARSIRSLQKKHYDEDLAGLFNQLQKVEETRIQKTKLHLSEFGGLLANALMEESSNLRAMMTKWDRLVPLDYLQEFIDNIREDGPFEYPEEILLDEFASVDSLGILPSSTVNKQSNSLSRLSREPSTLRTLFDSPEAMTKRLEELEREQSRLTKQRDGAQILFDMYTKQPELANEQTRQEANEQLIDLSDRLSSLQLERDDIQTRLASLATTQGEGPPEAARSAIIPESGSSTLTVMWEEREEREVAREAAQEELSSPLLSPAPGEPNAYLSSIDTNEAADKKPPHLKSLPPPSLSLGDDGEGRAVAYQATALFDFDPSDSDRELQIKCGDVLTILADEGEWWHAQRSDGRTGYVPFNFVLPCKSPDSLAD